MVGESCYILAKDVRVSYGKEDPHKYLLSFLPPVESMNTRREIVRFARLANNMLLAFDGTRFVYAAVPLPFTSKNIDVTTTDVDGYHIILFE
ncbi:hypothetical protein HanIR_Chr04g0195541 [Helianthus annuus]|nr:hypothetical protein HanIR_Chr04g0195541 [Helianthus annuus]